MKKTSNKTILIILPIVLSLLFSCVKDAAFYNNRGITCYQKGQYDLAIAYYNGALDIDPRNDKAYNNRGVAYKNKGQYDQAISDYNKALEINPRYANAYYNRGVAYKNKGHYDQAISDFNKALEINPRFALAHYIRGDSYYENGLYDQAIADYNKALEINPRFAGAYNALAWLLATAKEPRIRDGEKALKLALKACELTDWKNSHYLDTLAAAYARVDDYSNAIKWQKKALESPSIYKQYEAKERLNSYQQHRPWPADKGLFKTFFPESFG